MGRVRVDPFAVSGGVLAVVLVACGLLGILPIGRPILVAGILALVAASRPEPAGRQAVGVQTAATAA